MWRHGKSWGRIRSARDGHFLDLRVTDYSGSLVLFIIACAVLLSGCKYSEIDSENGRLAILQEANLLLTNQNCDKARTVLFPLYSSGYVTNEIRLVYASSYACSAGFDFPTIVGRLQDLSGQNFFNVLARTLYSSGADSHEDTYISAAQIIRQTASPSGQNLGVYRPNDANIYMVFMQLGVIGSILSSLGHANQTTGAKTTTIIGAASNQQACRIKDALADIIDSLGSVAIGGAMSTVYTLATSVCTANTCVSVTPGTCGLTEITAGQAALTSIDSLWP